MLSIVIRRLYLLKRVKTAAPEGGPPLLIQTVDITVFFLQPFSEFRLTQLAMAFALNFVGNVPQNYGRMICKTLCKLGINQPCLLAEYRRGIAMVMPSALKISYAAAFHSENFGIFFCHPWGLCAGRRCKNSINSVIIKPVYNAFKPTEGIDALLRLKRSPWKYTDWNAVYTGLLH